jgi:hypothetical protein
MEAICSFETSGFLQTRQRYNPEDSTRHSRRRWVLKSNIMTDVCVNLPSVLSYCEWKDPQQSCGAYKI